MAIKVYGDKIVFPDNTEQTTAADSADTSYTKAEIDAQQEAQDVQIESKVPEAPDDGETYARNNKTWVGISDSSGIPDAPVDGLQYGRQDGEWTEVEAGSDTYTKSEIDSQQKIQDDAIVENNDDLARQQIEISNQQTSIDKNTGDITTESGRITANTDAIAALPTPVDAYTKAESDVIDNAQDTEIQANTDAIAALPTPVDSYTKAEIDTQQGLQDTNISSNATNISSNTSAIGTLSGQVGQNSDDIAELQDSIFFSSAYSADYPSAPNRDPEDGNMYLQNLALFTYSYAEATQIFASKTDESGNVRQFTAIKPGDSIVLNEVDSPNYGRYELVTVEEVSDSYVVMNVIPMLGQGTVITGVKVAFQAFPKPGSDSIWTLDTDISLVAPEATFPGNIVVDGVNVGTGVNGKTSNVALGMGATGTVKNVSAYNNVAIGSESFGAGVSANNSVAVGYQAMFQTESGVGNTAVGSQSLYSNVAGKNNTAIGNFAGGNFNSGDNNILIGNNAQASADGVSNEVTIGDDNVTVTRLKGNVLVGDTTWDGGPTTGLAIQASSSDGSPFAMYIKNSNDAELVTVRCNGDTTIGGALSVGTTTTMSDNLTINTGDLQITDISSNASTPNMVITESGVVYKSTSAFYSTKEVDGLVNAKDAIINKLTERLDDLELKFKALK